MARGLLLFYPARFEWVGLPRGALRLRLACGRDRRSPGPPTRQSGPEEKPRQLRQGLPEAEEVAFGVSEAGEVAEVGYAGHGLVYGASRCDDALQALVEGGAFDVEDEERLVGVRFGGGEAAV